MGGVGKPQTTGGHPSSLTQVPLLLTSCRVARPSMALWKYSVVVVSFISLSLLLLDNTKEHLEYSISLVRSRNRLHYFPTLQQGGKFSLRRHSSITTEVLKGGYLKIQESVKKR